MRTNGNMDNMDNMDNTDGLAQERDADDARRD